MTDLFMLPFDHRGSFQEKLFGIKGRTPTPEERREIAAMKQVVYEGFLRGVASGVPKSHAALLVDEEAGAEILLDARSKGYLTACPVEKSGQDEFDFEYGEQFPSHIERFQPTYVKVLVRYNPEGDRAMNDRQARRLRRLSEYCHQQRHNFLFELLLPPTREQITRAKGDLTQFDTEFRPQLMVRAMAELQNAGVEPHIWKVEGLDTVDDCYRLINQAQAQGRREVGIIVLGRNESVGRVVHWLTTAASVPGFVGFAIGRTIFWNPLKEALAGSISRDEASNIIARNYRTFSDYWLDARRVAA